jgi:hypothetical protein
MRTSRRENACCCVGVVSTIFCSALISEIVACYYNRDIVIWIDVGCMFIFGVFYFLIMEYIENIPENESITEEI